MNRTILVCDNEDVLACPRPRLARGNGYDLVEARDGDEALALARTVRPDLILLDDDARAERLRGARRPALRPRAGRDPGRDADRSHPGRRPGGGSERRRRPLAKPFSPLQLAALVEDILSEPLIGTAVTVFPRALDAAGIDLQAYRREHVAERVHRALERRVRQA